MAYEAVIGIEVHAELATETKLFCGCSTQFGAPPNSQTCPVCLGLPGVLPVMNRRAFEYALRIALALECQVDARTSFDRKNYYYPDLPKNYQISQSYHNIGREGRLDIIVGGAVKRIGMWNVHLEEDAGKLVHPEGGSNYTLVDLNRAGMPLLEMVSAPDMRSSAEVDAFMRALRNVLLRTEVADCKIHEGKLRFEPSISLRPVGQKELGARVEIKNVGSISAVVRAVDFEIARQTRALESGEKLSPETRLWDESLRRTAAMRRKETSADYRYFPEPDLVHFEIDEKWKEEVCRSIPELSLACFLRFKVQYELSEYNARELASDFILADYFEDCVKCGFASPVAISNWLANDVVRQIYEHDEDIVYLRERMTSSNFAITLRELLPPYEVSKVIGMTEKEEISHVSGRVVIRELLTRTFDLFPDDGLQRDSTAESIVKDMNLILIGRIRQEKPAGVLVMQVETGRFRIKGSDAKMTAEQIVHNKGLMQDSNMSYIVSVVLNTLATNEKSVADYKAGKKAAFNALIGFAMRETKVKLNAKVVREVLENELAKRP